MDIASPDGSLALDDHGHLALVSGAAAARQRIVSHLRLWRGEWALDTAAGIPYYDRVLGKQPAAVSTAAVSTAVRRIPDVLRIDSIAVETAPADRATTLRLTVETADGQLSIAVAI